MAAGAKPPFKADQVGSLLRPAEIKEARAKVERGEMGAERLSEIEDRCIARAVERQESLGLRSITDGEYRRGWWNHDFLGKIDGVEIELDAKSYKFAGSDDPRYTPQVRSKVRRSRPMMLDHFKYLRSVAKRTPKFTMPSPSILYHRGGRAAISREAYPDLDELWRDVGRVYREEIRDLAAAGCTYLQIDDTSFSFLCDEKFRASCRVRGDDPEALPHMYARAVNAAIAERPAGMTIVMHTCRGNWKSTWLAEGGYEPVARAVFQETGVDGYFLEYDSSRPRVDQDPGSRNERRAEKTDRRGEQVRTPRESLHQPAVRLREHPPRQPADRGRAVEKAGARRAGGARAVGRRLGPAYSTLTRDKRIRRSQRAYSAFRYSANCSGVLPTASNHWRVTYCSRKAGSARILAVSA
jgi:5-methyltetrahydropteroyltriglutamate--homocysteine methyltransferase